MNIFLVVILCVVSVILLGSAVLLIAYFGHPDDKMTAWFPKAVVVAGLYLAFANVLALPADVANARGQGGGLDIALLWQIVYICIAVFLVIIIPFAYFYYENDESELAAEDREKSSQFVSALKWTVGFFICFFVIMFLLYSFINTARIPVNRLVYNSTVSVGSGNARIVTGVFPIDELVTPTTGTVARPRKWQNIRTCAISGAKLPVNKAGCLYERVHWNIPVTFPIYVMAFIAFIGWFLFCIFAGVGLVALPLDLIQDFITRPRPMSTSEYFKRRNEIAGRASGLIDVTQKLMKQSKEARSARARTKHGRLVRKLEKHVYFVKQSLQLLIVEKEFRERDNPLWHVVKLFFGILGVGMSFSWILHIIIFMLPNSPLHPFLNNLFIELEDAFGEGQFALMGVLAFMFYGYYLLWACVKGNFKLGIRFLIFKIFPMELHNTMMNAFLANTWVILLMSVPTVQFCTMAFPIYARFTDIDMLFGTQIKYLEFFRYFWVNHVFLYAILAFVLLSGIYLAARPRDASKKVEEDIKEFLKEVDADSSRRKMRLNND